MVPENWIAQNFPFFLLFSTLENLYIPTNISYVHYKALEFVDPVAFLHINHRIVF